MGKKSRRLRISIIYRPCGRTSGKASVESQPRDAASPGPLPQANPQVNNLCPVLEPHNFGRRPAPRGAAGAVCPLPAAGSGSPFPRHGPPCLRLLRQHLRKYGTAPDGRLFRGARGGILSESTYGRIWHAAREIALGPQLAATSLARRPYDLRHAALSLWLNATGAPAEVAARAGNSVHVLQDVYAHCTDGREDLISQQIEDALDPDSGTPHVSQCVTASGYANRWPRPDAVRHMSVNDPERPRRGPQLSGRALPSVPEDASVDDRFRSSEGICIRSTRQLRPRRFGPRMAHRTQPTVCVTAPFARKSR